MLSKLLNPESARVCVLSGVFDVAVLENESPLLPYLGNGDVPSQEFIQGQVPTKVYKVARLYLRNSDGSLGKSFSYDELLKLPPGDRPSALQLVLPPVGRCQFISKGALKHDTENRVRRMCAQVLRKCGYGFAKVETEQLQVKFAGGELCEFEIDAVFRLGDTDMLLVQFQGKHHNDLETVIKDAALRRLLEQKDAFVEKIHLVEIWYSDEPEYYSRFLKDEVHSRLSDLELVGRPENYIPKRGCSEELCANIL